MQNKIWVQFKYVSRTIVLQILVSSLVLGIFINRDLVEQRDIVGLAGFCVAYIPGFGTLAISIPFAVCMYMRGNLTRISLCISLLLSIAVSFAIEFLWINVIYR